MGVAGGDLKENGRGCVADAKGAPRASRGEVRGPQTAPSRIIDEAELLLRNLDGWKGMNGATMMQRGASTMSCGVEGRKTAFSKIQPLSSSHRDNFAKIRLEPVYPPLGLAPTRYNHEELRTNVPRCNGRFVL